MTLRVGSLFDGIGGGILAAESAGMQVVWRAEVDKYCNDVMAVRRPDIPNLGDVTKIRGSEIPWVDVIVGGGFPCQDLSVAGNRLGLAGKRSGLWVEFHRIVSEVMPTWVVIENVPGLLSSNKKQDIKVLLSSMQGLGYVVDMDVLDAQHFGVAQRRKRVFIVCQRVDHLLSTKTTTSALTILQCLVEILHGTLAAARTPSGTGRKSSKSKSTITLDGLKQRMMLFGLQSESTDRYQMLLENLVAVQPQSVPEMPHWACPRGKNAGHDISSRRDTASLDIPTRQCPSLNTESSWNSILAEPLAATRLFITSTDASSITESKISMCSEALLTTAGRIFQLNDYSPTYWSAASSALIAIQEYMNYAKQASSSLFTGMGRIQSWVDFHDRAASACVAIGDSGTKSWGEVQAISESMLGDTPPSRPPRAQVAMAVRSSTGGRGTDDPDRVTYVPVLECYWDGGDLSDTIDVSSVVKGQMMPEKRRFPVVLQSVSGDTPIIAFTPKDDGRDATEGIAPTLHTMNFDGSWLNGGGQVAVAFSENQRAEVVLTDYAHQLSVAGGKPGQGYPAVLLVDGGDGVHGYVVNIVVRRLTPLECERLQGYPCGWTAVTMPNGKPMSDSQRYRQLGNGFAVPCVSWIMQRIAEYDRTIEST